MVTGVEAAGLILGSIPLLVSALEHYAEGIETIHKWWRYKKELASLKRILGAEYDRFLNTCEELLAGIVPDKVLAELLEAPGGDIWRNPELERRLRMRLRKSFKSYLETVTDLLEVVNILKDKLELDPNGKPRWSDSKTFRREYKRIKFSLSKASYEELMKRIEKDNDTLANLTGQSIRLEPTRNRRKSPTTDFDRIRTQAESLYRVLSKIICSSCQTPHNARLRLEARTQFEDIEKDKKMRFRMVFGFDTSPSEGIPTPWKPRETEIESLELGEDGLLISSVSSASHTGMQVTNHGGNIGLAPEPYLGSGCDKSQLPLRPKRGVRWASDQSVQSLSTLTSQSTASLPAGPMEPPILNLCSAFKDCKGNERYLGFIVDGKHMHHQIYPVLQPTHKEANKTISLYKRLTSDIAKPRAKLTRKERLQLALTLSSSVLQLHKTPWLNERWGKNDILFLEGSSGPYVSRSFLPPGSPPQNPTATVQSLPIVRNETIFALGVILIELCLGSGLESLRSAEDLCNDGTANSLTDYLTARRLVNEVYDEGGGRYGDAVRRCIHCEFDQRKVSLDVEAFRQSFYQGVVQPLEDDWMDFCSINTSPRVGIS